MMKFLNELTENPAVLREANTSRESVESIMKDAELMYNDSHGVIIAFSKVDLYFLKKPNGLWSEVRPCYSPNHREALRETGYVRLFSFHTLFLGDNAIDECEIYEKSLN